MSTIAAARSSPMPFTIGSYVCVLRLLLSRTRLNAHIITPNKVQRDTKMLRKISKAKSRWRFCEVFQMVVIIREVYLHFFQTFNNKE